MKATISTKQTRTKINTTKISKLEPNALHTALIVSAYLAMPPVSLEAFHSYNYVIQLCNDKNSKLPHTAANASVQALAHKHTSAE